MLRTFLTIAGLTLLANGASLAQRPQFEVASIKPCSPDMAPQGRSGGGPLSRETFPERLTLTCSTVKGLINMAYVLFAGAHVDPLSSVPIEGGPTWINSDLYRIEAKAASAQSQETLHGAMLRKLLEDRFKLKIRRETRQIPVYALTVAKGGPKLERFKEGNCVPVDMVKMTSQFPPGLAPMLQPGQKGCPKQGTMKGRNVTQNFEGSTLDEFCKFALHGMDRPVIDKTGLTGLFNIKLTYAPDEVSDATLRNHGTLDPDEPSDDPAGTSIFIALQQQLGLKLDATKGAGSFLVIESVERPTGN
ncbi:MAG TPA: TIGR03435 family protein [Bryobacteraceae bacterium]